MKLPCRSVTVTPKVTRSMPARNVGCCPATPRQGVRDQHDAAPATQRNHDNPGLERSHSQRFDPTPAPATGADNQGV